MVRVIPRERVQKHAAERGVPQPREEAVEAVTSIPCERVQQGAVEHMVGGQSGVIEVTETASQGLNLQRTVEQTLLDFVKAVKTEPQKRIAERMCEQFGVIEVPRNSSQESVERVKRIPQRLLNGVRLSKCPRLKSRKC